ncbi:MAG: MBL fold metallo-hydrolase [Chloroflexi bacterium]|nr:MAG: MBL fold metallo-hydrolase [Chloroflexota bacterium]
MHTPYTIILAPNPSMMSGPGTNTIVLGSGAEGATIIDPAVDDIAYLDAIIKEGSQRGTIRRILITHGHPDHIGGALALKERLGVAIHAFSREGVPMADREITDGATFPAGDDTLRAIHTPGHRFDHLCYLLERQKILFAGDIIASVGTVVINPPEGDLQDYLDTLKRLQEMEIAEMVPSHGPPISDPQAKLAEYIEHRMQREEQVILALEELPRGSAIAQLVPLIYMDVDPRLHPVAARTVEAHLLKLEREGLVERLGEDAWALVRPTA